MLFNSFQFLVFFPVVTVLYFILPNRYRWVLLLMASSYFYMAFLPVYILILGFTILIDYFAGLYIEKSSGVTRKTFLLLSLFANIGILAVFKYYNFFTENINLMLSHWGLQTTAPHLSILLPIGLSFHTFQAMSYTIEVYRGNQQAERHLGIYALYVMFYPQLVAGPIERPQNLLHQFREEHKFDADLASDGLRLIGWGLLKKVVIADRLGLVVDPVYNNPDSYGGPAFLLATFFFSFQIYCDFSGYSDIARGTARVMGFRLMRNFDIPYQSKSISEFWTRWHISLSTWFRDYVYIPLGGNRVSVPRWCFNLFVVFLLSGLWHGADWTFVIWGALHGIYLIASILFGKLSLPVWLRVPDVLKFPRMGTFLLVGVAWIFFRADSAGVAFSIVRKILADLPELTGIFEDGFWSRNIGVTGPPLAINILLIVLLEVCSVAQMKFSLNEKVRRMPVYFRWPIYYTLILIIILMGVFEERQFIYFQF